MLQAGYWPWAAPFGYVNGRIGDQPILLPNKEVSCFIPHIFQDYLNGSTVSELAEKYTSKGMKTKAGKPIPSMLIIRILENPLYAGIIDYESWGVSAKGKHEPLVSPDLYALVKSKRLKLDPQSKTMGSSPAFPLRGLVRCVHCDKKLTASNSTGKGGNKFAYYRCMNGCKNTNTRKEDIEQFFFEVLKGIQLTDGLSEEFKKTVIKEYKKGREVTQAAIARTERELNELKQQKETIQQKYAQNKITDEEFKEMSGSIKSRILTKEIEFNENKISDIELEILLNNAEFYLKNFAQVWKNVNPSLRTRLQSQILPNGIVYNFDGTFGTPELSPLFRFIDDFNKADATQKSRLVDRRGFEPRTPALQRRCSTK